MLQRLKGIVKPGEERYLSYLPLAHMFERVCQAVLISLGGRIGFFQGDVRKLINDMQELKPTIFCTVPRLLNRIYSSVSTLLSIALNGCSNHDKFLKFKR
jgi:long-chain acyl-CoA synthetase